MKYGFESVICDALYQKLLDKSMTAEDVFFLIVCHCERGTIGSMTDQSDTNATTTQRAFTAFVESGAVPELYIKCNIGGGGCNEFADSGGQGCIKFCDYEEKFKHISKIFLEELTVAINRLVNEKRSTFKYTIILGKSDKAPAVERVVNRMIRLLHICLSGCVHNVADMLLELNCLIEYTNDTVRMAFKVVARLCLITAEYKGNDVVTLQQRVNTVSLEVEQILSSTNINQLDKMFAVSQLCIKSNIGAWSFDHEQRAWGGIMSTEVQGERILRCIRSVLKEDEYNGLRELGYPGKITGLVLGTLHGAAGGAAGVKSQGISIISALSPVLNPHEVVGLSSGEYPGKIAGLYLAYTNPNHWSDREDEALLRVATKFTVDSKSSGFTYVDWHAAEISSCPDMILLLERRTIKAIKNHYAALNKAALKEITANNSEAPTRKWDDVKVKALAEGMIKHTKTKDGTTRWKLIKNDNSTYWTNHSAESLRKYYSHSHNKAAVDKIMKERTQEDSSDDDDNDDDSIDKKKQDTKEKK